MKSPFIKFLHVLLVAAVFVLCGCETTPKPTPAPLAQPAIKPANDFEAALLHEPVHAEALAKYALQLATQANATKDSTQADQLRQRAVEFARVAQKHGTSNVLIPLLLEEIRPDGTKVEKTHSNNAEANRLIHEGEANFGRGDMDAALDCYRRALKADPTSSRAALYAGDVYFTKREFADALPWFEQAIALQPDSETPYRYRADALMRLRRYDEAGANYIDAFLCAPFTPIPTQAFTHWISERRMKLQRPDSSFIIGSIQPEEGKFSLVLHSEKTNWISLAYAVARAKYADDNNISPKNYRHSLTEELTALRTVITIAGEMAQNDPANEELKQHKPVLDLLAQLDREGLLEAHILLDRLNESIAGDYVAYLAQHRGQLSQYIRQYWLNQT